MRGKGICYVCMNTSSLLCVIGSLFSASVDLGCVRVYESARNWGIVVVVSYLLSNKLLSSVELSCSACLVLARCSRV
jgi:hypothetical protein